MFSRVNTIIYLHQRCTAKCNNSNLILRHMSISKIWIHRHNI